MTRPDIFAGNEIGRTIFQNKYAADVAETWEERAVVVVDDVQKTYVPLDERLAMRHAIAAMQFIPGGRYLYYAGRDVKSFSNCYLLRALEDTREDWAEISWKSERCLSTGGGIGVEYSIYRAKGSRLRRTGGIASGPISKMRMVNEIGREVMQGGSRRSAIYASLNWQHPDAGELLHTKDWYKTPVRGTDKSLGDLKEADFNFPCPLDMTNISLNYDDAWLANPTHPTYLANCAQALRTGEPGFSFNFGAKQNETLRNAPVAGDTRVLTSHGYRRVKNIVGQTEYLWTGVRWAPAKFTLTKSMVPTLEICMSNGRTITCDPEHEFFVKSACPERALRRWAGEKASHYVACQAQLLKQGDTLLVQDDDGVKTRVVVEYIAEGITQDVFCCDVGVEEHSFVAEGVVISNCCEVVSEDDSDVCNLGSLNMANISTIQEFATVAYLASRFLLCGTLSGEVPYEKVQSVRSKNRRLGLGLMGVHEWLVQRGYRYEVVPELRLWLAVYREASEMGANELADALGINRPVAYRAIAPTGTIGMLAGTTTGIEPVFAVAYKRRYLKNGTTWAYQYVIDRSSKNLIEKYGTSPDAIESALDLAEQYERRISFQADVQDFVDMAISSTINMPAYGSEHNNDDTVQGFSETLAKYAPRLRGFTCYPDGARGGQPLVRMDYKDVVGHTGEEFTEQDHDICIIGGKGGSCGV